MNWVLLKLVVILAINQWMHKTHSPSIQLLSNGKRMCIMNNKNPRSIPYILVRSVIIEYLTFVIPKFQSHSFKDYSTHLLVVQIQPTSLKWYCCCNPTKISMFCARKLSTLLWNISHNASYSKLFKELKHSWHFCSIA